MAKKPSKADWQMAAPLDFLHNINVANVSSSLSNDTKL
jgi:hypothetical protein